VTGMEEGEGGWRVALEGGGGVLRSGKVLLATGLVDELPEIPGVKENWGAGVHHCTFCDGFEHRDRPWGLMMEDPALAGHMAFFKGWSGDLRVFTNGRELGGEALELLRAAEMPVEMARIAEVIGAGDGHALKKVVLADGREVGIESLWLRPKQTQSSLVTALGLALREDGAVVCDERGESSRAGVYVAGDATAGPAQQALLAAADGARVTFGIIRELVMGTMK
ncbi:MAG: Thioredoxin reductase, partial [Akkermansiaceae bacterium]|nr:Thioredoxin reductase [Akkermansiaceae bacterium]